jgi:antitoxin component YwqK of YwqJK toxin-antitoxin module
VQLITDDGRTIERSLENESGLESLRQIVGTVNGRFVLTITTRRTNDTFDQEIEGRLEDGVLNGPVRTYLVLDDKRQLVSEEIYSADMRQGAFVSYYPKTGRVQARTNFDAGTKNGEFSSYYPNGNRAVRMYYDHDQLNGLCEVYDNRGGLITSGTYQKGVPVSGTFVEDLSSFIIESIDNRPTTVQIATVNEAGKSTEVIERTINPKKR